MARRLPSLCAVLTLVGLAAPTTAVARFPPDSLTNLQVLPEDIEPRELVSIMAGFTRALGVRCTHCHVGEEGRPLSTYDFAADDRPAKEKARLMLRMVRRINQDHLASLEDRSDPPVRVECATCHRGTTEPRMLQDVLFAAYDAGGIDSTLTAYDNLREQYYGGFTYDFGEVPLVDVASQVRRRGPLADAERLLRLNVEHNPDSRFAQWQHAATAVLLAFQRGADAGVARYRELRGRYMDAAFPESLLNRIGYALLNDGGTAEAIAAFRLNVEAFPDAWNVHDSLGEGYVRAGDTDAAIASYERSLELNPDNQNARRMLERLRGGEA